MSSLQNNFRILIHQHLHVGAGVSEEPQRHPEVQLVQDQLIYSTNTSRNMTNLLGIPICKLYLLCFLAAAASFSFCLHILASSLAQSLWMALRHLQKKKKKKKIHVINQHKLWFKQEHVFQNCKMEESRMYIQYVFCLLFEV